MRRAFDEEADTNPDLDRRTGRVRQDRSGDRVGALEAEIAAAKEPPPESLPAPSPIRPVEDLRGRVECVNTGPIRPSYERIIQRLLAFRGGRRHCVILVASAAPGEGASTVARDLALALGQSQNGRVVLVDANMRQPSQRDAFKIDSIEGLADVLRDGAKLNSVLRVVPQFRSHCSVRRCRHGWGVSAPDRVSRSKGLDVAAFSIRLGHSGRSGGDDIPGRFQSRSSG